MTFGDSWSAGKLERGFVVNRDHPMTVVLFGYYPGEETFAVRRVLAIARPSPSHLPVDIGDCNFRREKTNASDGVCSVCVLQKCSEDFIVVRFQLFPAVAGHAR